MQRCCCHPPLAPPELPSMNLQNGDNNEPYHSAYSEPRASTQQPSEREAFLAQLRHAARDVGFFYLTDHGINDALQQSLQSESRRFFALSDEQKQQVAMIHSPHFRGYNRQCCRANARPAGLAGNSLISAPSVRPCRYANMTRAGFNYRGLICGQNHCRPCAQFYCSGSGR
ncbi:Uncharacterised protein [Kluyvera cryocrescens]|uniref:Non-haem dioxygenase N-terminal domain-containing protein n=1 Tax=Kluyvera cryocrescens TaxID=580 RepID=A0A485CZ80_KLUCR|nr:Uncharacterised protein [Kluyvera cryocrescens]